MSSPRYRPIRITGVDRVEVEDRPGGVQVLRSPQPLEAPPPRLTDRLAHWAAVAPERLLAARRDPAVAGGGDWIRLSYAEMLERARRIAGALLARGLGPDRPVAVLSDNDLEHLSLMLGAMWAGIPIVPISPAYSLMSQDHAKLRYILERATPGLVFASGPAYAKAIAAAVPPATEVVLAAGSLLDRRTTPWQALLDTPAGSAAEAAHAAVGPQTIAKLLFTSGSTKAPKGVINTHLMLCANQQMLAQTFAFLGEHTDGQPPVLLDWLPWNHTFGGNHNLNLVLYQGGSLYIDDGKPTPAGIATTLRNLREVAPSIYFNVPKGFEEIVSAMQADDALRRRVFSRVQAFFFAGAGLSQAVWDQLDRHAEATVGERVRMLSSLGMTETAPACTLAWRPDIKAGHVGLPLPGVEIKLVPAGDKHEIRFRGPNVMPGYWREPELSREAFDEDGFLCSGDAGKWVEAGDPSRGLLFDGRIAEDFKLSSGTFVSVGPLRARVIGAGSPCVQDVVVTGLNRDALGLLLFPRLDECRKLAGLAPAASADEVLAHPEVEAFFAALLARVCEAATGGSTRPAWLHVLREPPSIDRGEITDKGSINQRAVLAQRAALIDALYEGRATGRLLPVR